MKPNLLPLIASALASSSGLVTAATIVIHPTAPGLEIRDGDSNGLASQIAVSSAELVTSLELTLVTSSGWNGDLYAYLEHNGVIAVLLNRPGRSSSAPEGSPASGMNVTFTDSSFVDVHTTLAGGFSELSTGSYQPDGRAADPGEVTEESPRTLSLSGFSGQYAAGDWTLFIADLSSGDTATLESWSLSLTTEAEGTAPVPEVSSHLALLVLGSGGLLIRQRLKRAASQRCLTPLS